MKLFTPFTIPKKDNCDLSRIKRNNQKSAQNPSRDQSFLPNLIIATGTPTVKETPITRIKIPRGEKISTPNPV